MNTTAPNPGDQLKGMLILLAWLALALVLRESSPDGGRADAAAVADVAEAEPAANAR